MAKRKSLEKKLAAAISVVNLLNAAAPIALPYVNVARNVSTAGGHSESLTDSLARAFYGTAQATSQQVNGETKTFSGGTMVDGDIQQINFGGTGIVEIMSGGYQFVGDGTNQLASVGTMYSGTQSIGGQDNDRGVIDVMSGGMQEVGDSENGTVKKMSGGVQKILFRAIGTVQSLGSGGTQIVYGGGTSVDTKDAGGVLELHNGAKLKSGDNEIGFKDYALSGGTMRLTDSASISGYTVKNGTLELGSGGTATSTTVASGGTQNVASSGTATSTTVNEGGVQNVASGGTATGAIVNGGVQNVNSGATGSVTHMSGGTQRVWGTGTVTTMHGGTQNVYDNATGSVGTMSSGVQEILGNHGYAIITTMEGGTQKTTNHTSATISTMKSGTQIIRGNSASGAITSMTGGVQTIDGTNASATVTTMTGGVQEISRGTGTVSNFQGGTQVVLRGGTSKDTTDAGGVLELHGGAVLKSGDEELSYDKYALSGGTMRLTDGAAVDSYTVSVGTLELASGGTATNTTVSGGTQNVGAGAVVNGTVLEKGVQNILSGATVSDTTLTEGVTQNVSSGGTATGTTVNGGTQNVESGGVASGGTLKSGTQNVASGGTAAGVAIEGGSQNIESGATVSDTKIGDGGTQIVSAGGTATGTILSGGATQKIASGGLSEHVALQGGTITVDDYGTAQIDKAEGGAIELLDLGLATAIFGNVTDAAAGSYTVDSLYARGDAVILGQGDGKTSPVGNTLNIKSMDGYANFVVNTDLANNKSDEIHIGTATNATKANTIRINYDPTLAKKQTISSTNTKVAVVDSGTATFEGAKSTIGGVDYLPTVETTDGGRSWYITGLGKKGASDGSHHPLMGMTAATAALAAGNAFIDDASRGLGLMANTGKDGVSAFAKLGGGSVRQETGSHVDVNTWNAILALGHKNEKEKSSFEYGAFFEYGSGNYTTHENDLRGDGSMKYTGGGLLAKWTASHGLYVEGSLRAGTVHDDASNVLHDDVNTYSYDTNAGYFGAHLGVGKEIEVAGGNTLDVYGKFFFNRRNGVSFETGGNAYDLDAVRSEILRVGARYTMKREKWNFYGGLAYEYEMDGKATGTVDGLAIRGADIGGGSVRAELGATMQPDANSPWSLDLNLSGFAGKKRGISGGVSVAFMF